MAGWASEVLPEGMIPLRHPGSTGMSPL